MKYIPPHALSTQYLSSLTPPQYFVACIGGFKAGHSRGAYQPTTSKLTAMFGKGILSERQDLSHTLQTKWNKKPQGFGGSGGMNMPTYKRYSLLSVICEILYKDNFGLLLQQFTGA